MFDDIHSSLLERLISFAQQQPSNTAISYLDGNLEESLSLSYAELLHKVKVLASYLQEHLVKGDRVILAFPAGPEFIIAFLACLFSGNIAVPLVNPDKFSINKTFPTILNIIKDADPKLILACPRTIELLQKIPEFKVLQEAILVQDFNQACGASKNDRGLIFPLPDDVAYLQYTSGSTSTSKAVVTTFRNLTASLYGTAKAWEYTQSCITMNWAPHTHVYGLTCGLLLPLFVGSKALIMSTATFLLNPVSWLKAVTQYKATHSGCPNFGYNLCISQITPEEMHGLNLSSWQVAINGGEAVQQATLQKFYEKFKECGFSYISFCSAYGMSESTGLIASVGVNQESKAMSLDPLSLQNNYVKEAKSSVEARSITSSGQTIAGLIAKVIDPVSLKECMPNVIGEIWLSGPSCSKAYWRKSEESLFKIESTAYDEHQYIRTGDLGFIKDEEIYLVGRLKELIIINGKNFHPLDIETTVVNSHITLTNQLCVAFSAEKEGSEKLFIIQGVKESNCEYEFNEISHAIRKAVSLWHGLDIYQIAYTNSALIPKTPSGKIQRKVMSANYFSNKIDFLYIDSKHSSSKA